MSKSIIRATRTHEKKEDYMGFIADVKGKHAAMRIKQIESSKAFHQRGRNWDYVDGCKAEINNILGYEEYVIYDDFN